MEALSKYNEQHPKSPLELEIVRRPFFLFYGGPQRNPDVPRKWGDRLDASYPGGRRSIARLGAKAGRTFNFDVELSDTMDSWRLALWASDLGKAEEFLSAVGRRYFEEGEQLGNHSMLLSAVAETGLDKAAAEHVLEDEHSYRSAVMQQYKWAVQEEGIDSIPVFIFRNLEGTYRTSVRGSASVGEFLDALNRMAEHVDSASNGEL
eukprot:TRINITY_DN15819_c0_g1_i2.p1 TRINITY_DN15819_c0_g1~~TRINITY_DN15819_c0_g1_i2.p1  ORF type:complete len:206 (+),score=23.08 TRINITY_DN15819_c0_g1_i2:189-806(+)